ncbi:MAG TPA: cobalamin B12-binding domain-containing protein [Sphingorhabdus sp.]|nr:cobalamin B12-binding domain-containing protein [Sphingorhabdus sp.]
MATVFGISGLKSRLDGWRASWRSSEPKDSDLAELPPMQFTLVERHDDSKNLSLLLENLVIPRLIADRDNGTEIAPPIAPAFGVAAISNADVEEFTRLSLEADTHELLEFADRCLETGASVETVYVELLAPAARRLGEFWEDDSQDFVAVTMGLWRIQETLRELTLRIPPKSRYGQGQRCALFSPMPGEQHSFGTLMVAECFERAGWDTDVLIEPTQSELTAKFANRHYDLIGLTVSCDCSTGALSSLVNTIKAVSANPHIRIMMGGRVVNDRPSLVVECGADATAIDARAAVELADRLVPAKVSAFDDLR